MVKHIVCAKLKDPTPENIDTMKKLMLSMKDNISLIRSISVEEDFLHSPDSFDIMLFSEFDSRDDLMKYIAHPYHAEYIQTESAKYVKDIRIMDFDF